MKTTCLERNHHGNDSAIATTKLDLETIRRRVAAIKQSWSSQERRERAEQGKIRRRQLEQLLLRKDYRVVPSQGNAGLFDCDWNR